MKLSFRFSICLATLLFGLATLQAQEQGNSSSAAPNDATLTERVRQLEA